MTDRNCDSVEFTSRKIYSMFSPKLTAYLLLVLLKIALSSHQVGAQVYQVYCSAYCDINDNLVQGWYCQPPQQNGSVYCCGTVYNKTCCSDQESEINVAEETVCGHSWLYYQWSLIYGLVAVLMVVLMVIVCCVCCRGYQIISRRNQASASRQERGEGEPDAQSLGFDPSCEYAFEPPRYETLPKDPPKYSEVFSISEHENAAFAPDEQPVAPIPQATTTTTTAETTATTTAEATATATTTAEATADTTVSFATPSTAELPTDASSSDVTAQHHDPTSSSSSSSSTSGDVEPEAEVTVVVVEERGSEICEDNNNSSSDISF